MRAQTVRWLAGGIAAGSIALMVRSAPGQGTVVTARVPLPQASRVAERAGQAAG